MTHPPKTWRAKLESSIPGVNETELRQIFSDCIDTLYAQRDGSYSVGSARADLGTNTIVTRLGMEGVSLQDAHMLGATILAGAVEVSAWVDTEVVHRYYSVE